MTSKDLKRWLAMAGLTASSGGVGLCGGCASFDGCQLGLTHERLTAADRATFAVACPVERDGSRGVAHGGWIADIFDEVLGRLLVLADRFAVTGEVRVAFHRPVRIASPLEITVQEVVLPAVAKATTSEGTALVLVEQHVALALDIADRAIVLSHGRVALDERAAALREDLDRVEAAYFASDGAPV
jgi:acyl-coenzyme A thioesterase PaaI-like protein